MSWCKTCSTYRRRKDKNRVVGYVPLGVCYNVFLEVYQRLGSNKTEASRRLPMSRRGLESILLKRVSRVQAETLRRALRLRAELRRTQKDLLLRSDGLGSYSPATKRRLGQRT